ncbi:MAG: hypothetical protein Q7P63_01075 [Verrucomicrobiota bacterium JB022]|nr:hypothetical protein [Verrucomicrobiota bacterium JB022]
MSGGGKGGGKTVIGYDYYASFAGVAGLGTADALIELIVDGKSVWRPASPVLRTTAANPYIFVLAATGSEGAEKTYDGRVYFYWGTTNQVLTDPVLTKPGRSHPPYRRRVLVVFEDFYCGFERDSVPNMQIVYRREADQQTVVATLDNGQVSPMAVAAEWLTNPVTGVGLAASKVDSASWDPIAAALEDSQATEYLSVALSSGQRLREALNRLRNYSDVWFRVGRTGKIEAGRVLIGEEPAGLPVITADDLTDLPDLNPVTPAEVPDRINLKYVSESNAYQERIVRFDDPAGRIQTDGERDQETTMDWIVRDAQAAAKVTEIGEQAVTPYWEGSISVRFARWWDLGLQVGDPFVLEYAPMGFREVMRAEQASGFSSRGGPVRLRIESERRLRPKGADAGVDDPVFEAPEAPGDLEYFHVLQATSAAAGGEAYGLVALAGRSGYQTRYASLFWRLNGSAAFSEMGTLISFAVPVKLSAALSASGQDDDETGGILIEEYVPAPLGFGDIPGTQSEEEVLADNLLLIVVDGANYEILTVKSLESPVGDQYPVYALRGRLGTTKGDFSAGSPAYLAFRSQLLLLTSGAWSSVANASTTAERTIYVKAQPVGAGGTLDLVDATEHSLELHTQLSEPVIIDGNAAI